MEAYKVWVTLGLKGDALKKMQMFTKMTKQASSEVSKLSRHLKTFNGFSSSLNKTAINADRLAVSLTKVVSKVDSLNLATQKMERRSRTGIGMGKGLRHLSGFLPYAMATGGSIGGAIGVGAGILVKSSYETGISYQQQMMQLTGQNIPGLNKSEITGYLNKTKVAGTSKLDILRALTDAAIITKSKSDAESLAPILAMFQSTAQGMYGKGEYHVSNNQMQAAIKVAEISSGSKDFNVLKPYLENMFKSMLGSGGRVMPATYLSAFRSMRGYSRGLDPKFLFYMLDPLLQEYGTRTGPMLAQFYQHLKAGRLTTQGAQMLYKLGLVDKKNVQFNKIGMVKSVTPGAIHGIDKVDPFTWVRDYLTPSLVKHGFKNSNQQEAVIGKIFSNTDLTMVLTFMQQLEKFTATYSQNLKTSGLEDMNKSFLGSDPGKIKLLTSAFENLKLSLDNLTGPAVNSGLKFLTSLINGFAKMLDWLQESKEGKHPKGLVGEWFDRIWEKGRKTPEIANQISSHNRKNGMTVNTNVHLDGKVIARSTANHLSSATQGHQIAQHGPSGINTASSPVFSGISNLGGFGGA